MRYLLDANAVIGLLSSLTQRARRERPADVAISAIVAHELFYGASKSRRAAQNVTLLDALQFAVIELTKRMLARLDKFVPIWRIMGAAIGPYDMLIAGQARARNLGPGHAQHGRVQACIPIARQ